MSNDLGKIFIAGHNGMVGSAIERAIQKKYFKPKIIKATRSDLDLVNQSDVNYFFKKYKPSTVIIAAAKVGGIFANSNYPAEFIYENLMIEANLIHASYLNKINKLIFLGSSCIYPPKSKQPLKEKSLLSGYLEDTNEPYAIAKIAGIKLCESYNRQFNTDFRSLMPTNLYGPNDNYHEKNSHVIPALIRKIHIAKKKNMKTVVIWGSGKPLREFLHVDDLAFACIHVLNLSKIKYNKIIDPTCSHINVGTEKEISIKNLAILICDVIGYKGKLEFDRSKPDGATKKLMSSSKIRKLKWRHTIDIYDGIKSTYRDIKEFL